MSDGSRVIIITSDPDVVAGPGLPTEGVTAQVSEQRITIDMVRIRMSKSVSAREAGGLVAKVLGFVAKAEAES